MRFFCTIEASLCLWRPLPVITRRRRRLVVHLRRWPRHPFRGLGSRRNTAFRRRLPPPRANGRKEHRSLLSLRAFGIHRPGHRRLRWRRGRQCPDFDLLGSGQDSGAKFRTVVDAVRRVLTLKPRKSVKLQRLHRFHLKSRGVRRSRIPGGCWTRNFTSLRISTSC